MNIIYLDKLSFFSLFSLFFSRIDYSRIFYFNLSPIIKKLAKLFSTLGMLKAEPLPADFILGEIRDKKGGCKFIKILEDLRDICFEISEKELKSNNFLKIFSTRFGFREIVFFFEKIVAKEINDKVVFAHAAKWHADNKISFNEKSIIFFLEKDLWSKYLCQSMNRLGIRPIEYRTIVNSSYLIYLKRGKDILLSKIKPLLNISNTISHTNRDKAINIKEENTEVVGNTKVPLIAAWYTGKTVTFDLKKRSDFFWLLKSGIPRDQVLVYFDRADIPATEEIFKTLRDNSVNCFALSGRARTSDNIPLWAYGRAYSKLKRLLIKELFKVSIYSSLKLKVPSLFMLLNMLNFIRNYAYWYDFFTSNNIKIHISPADFMTQNIPKNHALEKSGGVNISYQWSNLSFSSIVMSGCSNVMFSFGPEYEWIWKGNRSVIDNLIYCGYITDYLFKEVRQDSFKLRKQLIDKGVKFVICFFDENSSDDRMSVILNKKSAATYKFFIEKVMEDETLGLIFKPGYPKTLYQRISSITDLIEKAKATGRCIFLDKGSYVTEQYPTEAAQAADLCVGLLLSGTVALESYLSGTPTVFLDLEKLYSNPIYQWGKEKVVFDNLDNMFSAIYKYRESPERMPGFGDLSSWAKEKDPFKDGNASSRIGQYINWLHDMFKQGKTREEAIGYANQRYAELWGKENVVKWR